MKKTIFAILSVILISTGVAKADEDRPITVSQLPATAQQFIQKYYKQEKVAFAKSERELFEVKYEVLFTNSTKVQFDRNGEWTEVDGEHVSIPTDLIPEPIMNYIKTHFTDYKIVKIERDKRKYEVELLQANHFDISLEFDKQFNLIDID